GSAASAARASSPLWAKPKVNSRSRIWRRKRCRINASKSASSSTPRILTGFVIASLSDRWPLQLAQPGLQQIEIDRLGDKLGSAELAGPAPPFVIAIGGHHDDRQLGVQSLDFAEQCQAVHARHVDVREDDDQLRLDLAGEPFERRLARGNEVQHIGALPRLAAEMLAEEVGDVGLVVDNQDADAHAVIPDKRERDCFAPLAMTKQMPSLRGAERRS